MEATAWIPMVEDLVQATWRRCRAPGVAVAVTDREGVRHTSFAGWANADARIPVGPATLFECGSIGKAFTAVLVLQLAGEGRLHLHAPVSDYLPWFRVQNRWGPITLHHLLSHSAGIIGGTDVAPDARFEVWALRDTAVAWEPGSAFHYSNVGYKAIGLVLERVAGQPYAQLVRERVLAPLGMRHTAAAITHGLRRDLAVGYEPLCDDEPLHAGNPLAVAPWIEADTADGCLSAPIDDLAAFARLLLNRGRTPEAVVLAPPWFRQLIRPAVSVDAWRDYAYGLFLVGAGGREWVSHSGGMLGYRAGLTADLSAGIGAVAMANGPFPAEELTQYVVGMIGGQPSPPRAAWAVGPAGAAEDWSALAGTYRSEDSQGGRVEVVWSGSHFVLRGTGGETARLDAAEDGRWVSDHPRWRRFAIRLALADEGEAVLIHGDRQWRRRATPPEPTPVPEEWKAYTGHYRGYNPWSPTFRVGIRGGKLYLLWPGGAEYQLVPIAGTAGHFRCTDGKPLPEAIEFDTVVDGQAWRAMLSGSPFFRFFTP